MNDGINRVRAGLPVPDENSLWYSTTGESARISDSVGNVVVIPAHTEKPRTLERRFWKLAMAAGCVFINGDQPQVLSQGGAFIPPDPQAEANERHLKIHQEMLNILYSSNYEAMTGDGDNAKPKVDFLSMACGFKVSAQERDALWPAALQVFEDRAADGNPAAGQG